MSDAPRYFPIMPRQSFKSGHHYRVDDLFRELRRINVTNLVLQVPYKMMLEHEAQAHKNHHQSITRLAERGGLSADEACAVLQDRPWHTMDYAGANLILLTTVQKWVRNRDQQIADAVMKDINK